MKKFLITLAFLPLIAYPAWADDTIAPPHYMETVMKCNGGDVFKDNECLKTELLDIIGKSFKPEQKAYLAEQLNEIEKTVDKSQLNSKNKEIQALGNDPEKIKKEKAENLNLIWKKLILDTLKMVNENRAAS